MFTRPVDPNAAPRSPAAESPSGTPTVRALAPAVALLATAVLWIPLERFAWGLPFAVAFAFLVANEAPVRRRRFLALASSVAILAVAPIHTGLAPDHFLSLGLAFAAAIAVPAWLLRDDRIAQPGREPLHGQPVDDGEPADDEPVITFRLFPRRLDRLDVAYTALSVPLAWAGVQLYFRVLAPEVPANWPLGPEPDGGELLRLFLGINGVGIWDELFFVNVGYAVLRALYPARWANPLQSVLYTAVLYDMAFRGAGWPLVTLFALTQGAMYERSRALLWVLIAHLVVDYWLFQGIVEAAYPGLAVWWH